jgi:outer membrane protein TolC
LRTPLTIIRGELETSLLDKDLSENVRETIYSLIEETDAAKEGTLGSSRQNVQVLQAELGRMQTMVNYATITAPFSGIITKRFADTGSLIQAGTASNTQAMPLVELAEDSRVHAKNDRCDEKGDSGTHDLFSVWRLGGRRSKPRAPRPIDIQVTGSDLNKTYATAAAIREEVKAIPGVSNAFIPQDIDAPSLHLSIDRYHADELGLSQKEIVSNVITALTSNGMIAPSYWVDPRTGNDYLLTVQYPEDIVKSLTDLKSIPIRASDEKNPARLDAVVNVRGVVAPTEVDHYQLQRVIDIYVAPTGEELGRVASAVNRVIAQVNKPEGIRVFVRGSAAAMNSSLEAFGFGLILSLLLVYLILVAQFRSFIDPFIILLAVPPGVSGVLLILTLTGTTLNVMSLMGVVMMVGIVVSNSILIVEFTHRLIEDGMALREAVQYAVRVRLRPILMTSLATIIGLLPMALKLGTGTEAYAPLARAIIGGLLASVASNATNIRLGASGGLNNPTILNRLSTGINISQLIFDFGRTLNLTAAAKFQALSEAQQEQANQLVLQAKNAVEVAYAELSDAMGFGAVQKFSLSDQPPFKFPRENVGLLVSKALQLRPEVVALRDQVRASQRQASADMDARFPKIEALGSLGRTSVGDSAVRGNYGAAGIDMEVPLWTGGLLSARQNEAEFRASARQKSLEEEENHVVEGVSSSWFDTFTALKNIAVADQLAATAQQGLQLAEAQYRAGETSIIEFSQAQLIALQAEISAASAKYDYQIDHVQLEFQIGTLPYRASGQVLRGVVPIRHR